MGNTLSVTANTVADANWPDEAALAAFRAWLQGLPSREAVDRYLSGRRACSASSRTLIGQVKRQLVAFASSRARADLAATLGAARPADKKSAKAAVAAIETLRGTPRPEPLIGDAVERWLPSNLVRPLHAAGLRTLAELTLRVPRRRRWWCGIAGLGPAGARRIEAFFAQHPPLTERARALVTVNHEQDLLPWERLVVPEDVDGSRGTFRAPRATCALDSSNDYEAVQAWLSLHESAATQKAYRKEAERLILWAVVERRAGAVVADHRGRHRLPQLPAPSHPARTLGRRGAAEVIGLVATLCGRLVGAFRCLRAVGAQCALSLPH